MSQQLSLFNEGTIEALARVLGECGTGSDISRVLNYCGLDDNSGESTKWRRLYYIFLESQRVTGSPNQVLNFIRVFLTPARYAGRSIEFETHRTEINTILVMVGLELGKDGQFRTVNPAATLDEAEKRVQAIRDRFKGRAIHHEVNKYCNKELMQENYFHAVFEAAKGLAQRIREMSGADGDGSKLIDCVFSVDRPLLAINSLRTETEKSEHKGFAQLLKGCFAAVRNPLAHEPKILWTGEDDAADYLSLLSLLHRKLDGASQTRLGGNQYKTTFQ